MLRAPYCPQTDTKEAFLQLAFRRFWDGKLYTRHDTKFRLSS